MKKLMFLLIGMFLSISLFGQNVWETLTPVDFVIKTYGQPDDIEEHVGVNYHFKMYTYHCTKGKYRIFDFIYKNRWEIESVSTSGCFGTYTKPESLTPEDFIKIYGQPDFITERVSIDSFYMTYVYYCAKGKCRSFDFIYIDSPYDKNGWEIYNEYIARCVK